MQSHDELAALIKTATLSFQLYLQKDYVIWRYFPTSLEYKHKTFLQIRNVKRNSEFQKNQNAKD